MGCNKKQVAALDRRDQWLQLRGGDRAEQQLATGFLHVTNTQITRLPLTSSLTKQISHQQGEMWRNLLKLYIFGFSRLSTQNSQSMLSQLALNPWSTPPSLENRYKTQIWWSWLLMFSVISKKNILNKCILFLDVLASLKHMLFTDWLNVFRLLKVTSESISENEQGFCQYQKYHIMSC